MWVGTLTLGTLSQSLRIPTTWGHHARRKAPVRLTIIGAIVPIFHDTWKYQAALLKSQLTNVESGLETKCLDHRPKRAFSAVTSIRILLYGLNRHRCHKGYSGLAERSERYLERSLSFCPHEFKYYRFLCVPRIEKLGKAPLL